MVNIITKKQITGLHINGSVGVSQQGDNQEQRVDAQYGFGDLSENHFNVYVAGEYQKDAIFYSRDRGYPYNTADFSKLCGPSGSCRTNGQVNGFNADGTYVGLGTGTYPVVRPYTATNAAAIAGSRYQLLNPTQGCGSLTTITLNAAQATANPTAALTNCLQDNRNLYSVISPAQERIGGSARATFQVNDNTQAYVALNFYQSDIFYTGTPQSLRPTSAAGGPLINGALATLSSLALPVYVCPLNGQNATFVNSIPTAAGGCTAATPGAKLNSVNNPFAAAGQTARIIGLLQGIPTSNERRSRSYRAAAGINGSFGDGFDYSVEGTYNRDDLRATYNGYPNLQAIINAVADGSYNFATQSANTAAVRNALAPGFVNNAKSELAQVQVTLRKNFFDLPGGPLGVAIGGSFRYESVFAPSANAVLDSNPYNTYSNQVNRFGTSGSRGVSSGFFEINAPIFDIFSLNGSGRYDSYSSGQHNFSPKIGGKFTPIKQISFVSTFSKGFRIPSFAESYGLPTTGYITQTPPANYQALCPNIAPAGQPAAKSTYCTGQYSLGLTSVGNPNLRPEKATNFTGGIIINPVRNVSLRVDYYNIYKKDLITGADYAPQIAAYYGATAGTGLTTGVTGITTDTVGFATVPAGQAPYPLLSTIQYGFINANSAKSTGIDFDLETSYNITPWLKWTSSLEANYVIELSTTINGVKQLYQDSLGPYQTTSASGTPQWRGSWQNTFDFGKVSLTGTAYYSGGYSEGSADDGNTPDGQACTASGSYALYRDGTIVACRVKKFIDVDLTGAIKVNDQFTLYGNVLNVFGVKPPYDPSTYGASNYNPAWANAGIIGRYFRVGARVKF